MVLQYKTRSKKERVKVIVRCCSNFNDILRVSPSTIQKNRVIPINIRVESIDSHSNVNKSRIALFVWKPVKTETLCDISIRHRKEGNHNKIIYINYYHT